jgi:predicted AAA+ superfamily ATPase
LRIFPVVALVGARQTGKTVLSKKLRPLWRYVDLENPNDFEMISRDAILYFEQFPSEIIFDEAQSYPKLFEILRGVVDQRRQEKGRFILTGSSSPELFMQISESLAGRIGIVEIGTLKANEYYQKPLSPFYKIFEQQLDKGLLDFREQPLSNAQMRQIWLKGGYPEPLLSLSDPEYSSWMQNYRDTYVNRDIARLFPQLNRNKFQRFITMLADLSGTIVNKSEVGRALEFNESTAREYLHIANNTFIWREILSYENSTIKSIVKMPKGYIRDPGLLHFLTGIQDMEALMKSFFIGSSFEGFVTEELLKGLESMAIVNWDARYYRTRSGVEVDLVLSGPFGVLPVEIKYGTMIQLKQLDSLTRFVEDNHLPFGLLINQASEALWLSDRIFQVPVGWI